MLVNGSAGHDVKKEEHPPGSLRFLITWCLATEIIAFCILLPCGTIPNICPEITLSFMLKLLGAFVSSISVASKVFNFSCSFSFPIRASLFARSLSLDPSLSLNNLIPLTIFYSVVFRIGKIGTPPD